MEPKPVVLADAFADEPMGGVPVPVIPGEATDAQLRAVAGELGADGALCLEALRYVSREGEAVVEAAVAGATVGFDRGLLEPGTHTMALSDPDGSERSFDVELSENRQVRVALSPGSVADVATSVERIAPALGAAPAAIAELSDELPPAKTAAFGGTLLVPFAFLEALGGCEPDRETLAGLLRETETVRLCGFSFDTLGRRADLHVRVFDPRERACERPASGVAVAGCGRYLAEYGAFDATDEPTEADPDGTASGSRTLRVECGRFLDRPATVVTSLDGSRVGGTALAVLDGSVSLPEASDDEIVEL